MRRFFTRLLALVGRKGPDREMDEEISSHLEFAATEFQSQGMRAEDARLAARRHFGGVTQTKEAERETRGFPLFEDVVRDLRYAVRGLSRNSISTAAIVALLALGIGANT